MNDSSLNDLIKFAVVLRDGSDTIDIIDHKSGTRMTVKIVDIELFIGSLQNFHQELLSR